MQVTAVSPSSKKESEGGVQVTGTGPFSSSAVGLKDTAAPVALLASAAMFSRGGLNTGGSLSQVELTLTDSSSVQTGALEALKIVTNAGGAAMGAGARRGGMTVGSGLTLTLEMGGVPRAIWPNWLAPAQVRSPRPLMMQVSQPPAWMDTAPL